MCGRYSLDTREFSQIRLPFDLRELPGFAPRYNIAPTSSAGYEVPIVRLRSQRRSATPDAEAVLARWWFIPHTWTGPLGALPTTFNARSEELSKKPTWSESFARRRCLVPATGWREFMGEPGKKRGFQFEAAGPFYFAGIWDRYVSSDGEVVDSFAIVTSEAQGVARPIHDRMPVIVPFALAEPWLAEDGRREAVLQACVAQQRGRMRVYEVSTLGNSVHAEGPECIAPLKREAGAAGDPSQSSSRARQLKLF